MGLPCGDTFLTLSMLRMILRVSCSYAVLRMSNTHNCTELMIRHRRSCLRGYALLACLTQQAKQGHSPFLDLAW